VSRTLSLLIASMILALLAPSVARADVTLAEGTPTVGYVHLVASATPAADDLRIVEEVDGADVGVATTPTADGIEARTAWTCQSNRVFAAITAAERSAPIAVATPSCADRLHVLASRNVGLGSNIRVSVFDRWQRGGVSADICAVRPDAERTCDHVVMPSRYETVAHAVYRASLAGEWRVEVSDPTQTASLPVIVVRKHYPGGRPTVLSTGDSMMLATTTALWRRLSGIARTVSDVYVGSAISRPLVIDWATLPAKQVRAYRPDATVISLGMGDGLDLPTPDGPAHCCGPEYVAAYAQRARAIMRTYSRGGRGAVVWLNDPYQREPLRWPEEAAVNSAAALAARGLTRVKVVDLAAVLTPDGTYQAYMTRRGVKQRIRMSDGIHLTRAGARIASRLAITALHHLGVKVR
jgi:hypothetical protein